MFVRSLVCGSYRNVNQEGMAMLGMKYDMCAKNLLCR